MRGRRAPCVLIVCVLVAVITLAHVTSTRAQVDVALPGVDGTHEYAELTGWIFVPEASVPQDVRLVVSGTQIAGVLASGCPPSHYPAGAEVHLRLSFAGVVDWLFCSASLPAVTGDLVVELPCHRINATAWLSGPNQFWMYIGYDPNFIPVCSWYAPAPQLTIVTARLIASTAVATEPSSWGTLKSLFR